MKLGKELDLGPPIEQAQDTSPLFLFIQLVASVQQGKHRSQPDIPSARRGGFA
jgi:hypothetical protein